MATTPLSPTVFVIFGGGGDLTWRKLVPALYNLWLDKLLPEQFQVLAVDGKVIEQAELLQHMREGIDKFSRRGKTEDAAWQAFSGHLGYLKADFSDSVAYTVLAG